MTSVVSLLFTSLPATPSPPGRGSQNGKLIGYSAEKVGKYSDFWKPLKWRIQKITLLGQKPHQFPL